MSECQSQIQQGDPAPGSVGWTPTSQKPPRNIRSVWLWNGVSVSWMESTSPLGKDDLTGYSHWMAKTPPAPPLPPIASPSPVRQGDEAVSPVDVKEKS